MWISWSCAFKSHLDLFHMQAVSCSSEESRLTSLSFGDGSPSEFIRPSKDSLCDKGATSQCSTVMYDNTRSDHMTSFLPHWSWIQPCIHYYMCSFIRFCLNLHVQKVRQHVKELNDSKRTQSLGSRRRTFFPRDRHFYNNWTHTEI